MLKTDQNLRLLEKRIRQTISLVEELRRERNARPSSSAGSPPYEDLPLLQGLLPGGATPTAAPDAWRRERAEIRSRIRRIMDEIERVID